VLWDISLPFHHYYQRLLFLLANSWSQLLPEVGAMLEDVVPICWLNQVQKHWHPSQGTLQNQQQLSVDRYITLWVELLGSSRMEAVIFVVYKKLAKLLGNNCKSHQHMMNASSNDCIWSALDTSVLAMLLPWKQVLFPFLWEKLLVTGVSPKIQSLLDQFVSSIWNPSLESGENRHPDNARVVITDLHLFWLVMKWWGLIYSNASETLTTHFVKLLDTHFFQPWLSHLFHSLTTNQHSFSLDSYLHWYSGWKKLFVNYDFQTLYDHHLYRYFHHALELIALFSNNLKVEIIKR
jgi:hypothetical protein